VFWPSIFRAALNTASTLLGMKHGMSRLDSIWGHGGAIRPTKSLSRQIVLLLKEYLDSGDAEEAHRCLAELEVPHFHHEVVYEVRSQCFERFNISVLRISSR
jgi:hypothetical protein